MNDIKGVITPELKIVGVMSPKLEVTANIVATGPRGEKGEKGDKGDKGDTYIHPETHPASMIVEDTERKFLTEEERQALLESLQKSTHVHNQIAPLSTWTIDHPLNKFPSVSIVDSAGNLVIGDVQYVSTSQVIVSFVAQFSGRAYLN